MQEEQNLKLKLCVSLVDLITFGMHFKHFQCDVFE